MKAVLIFILTSFLATPIAAQQRCGPRADVMSVLAERYGETRQAIGLTADSRVMELFASDESGTWTITATSANGITCLVGSGKAFGRFGDNASSDDDDT